MSITLDIKHITERLDAAEKEIIRLKTTRSETFDLKELENRTGYKINTLHKKVKLLTLGVHYFKPNNGKLLFDESAIDFLIKGGNTKNGKSIHKKGLEISLDNFLAQ